MSKFKNLQDINVKNKRVLVRVDFDVPIKNGKILDDFRIKRSLQTINYLIKQNCKVILIAHLGRPNGKVVKNLSLKPVAKILSKLLKKKSGDVLLLENIRFFKEEEGNSPEFAKKLAKLGDFYVNEAFANSHRNHTSIVGIPKLLPSAAGFLLEKEIKDLNKILKNPKRPLIAIIGGVKMETKIKVINKFLKIADKVLIGGALADTIFASQGIFLGSSVIDSESFDDIKKINLKNPKLFLPIDLMVWDGKKSRICGISNFKNSEKALDIGPKTAELFCEAIRGAKTIIWNGPLGMTKQKLFAEGSKKIINCIAKSRAYSIAGGGDTIDFINDIKKEKAFDHLSTGGGAMLDYLVNETLPGIEALKKCKKFGK